MISDSQKNQMIPIDEYPHIDIQRLIDLSKAKSFRMPSGLTREQRHEWARNNLKQK